MNRRHHPDGTGGDDFGQEEKEIPPVADPETGEIRVLEDRCGHCILNPAATALPLRPGRVQQFTTGRRAAGGHVICHSTYPPIAPRGTPAAICRGYADAYGLPKAVQDVIDLGMGYIVEVPDPTQTASQQVTSPDRGELNMEDQESTTPWRCEVAWHTHTSDWRGPTCRPDSVRHPELAEEVAESEGPQLANSVDVDESTVDPPSAQRGTDGAVSV
jgi:hypothetical protein